MSAKTARMDDAPSVEAKLSKRSLLETTYAGPLLVVAIASILRLVLADALPLTPDEAYYALWTQHLAPGYLDHPPAVAFLGALSLRTLGHSELALRLPAVLCQAAAALLAYALVRERAGARAGMTAVLLLTAVPSFSLAGALLTPDAPLALAWVATFFALDRALRVHPAWMLATGVALGVGALSKLTAGLLGLSVLLALVVSNDGRRLLRTPWPWIGAVLSFAIASPFLAWNAARGWPSFGFQAHHVLRGGGFSPLRLLASIGAQLAYVSPVVLVASSIAAYRALAEKDAFTKALAFAALPVAVFFTAAAALTPGALPHWPGPGWLSATLLLSIEGAPFVKAAVRSGLALVALVVVLIGMPWPPRLDPLRELRGWREVATIARMKAGEGPIAATHWIALGELSWYDRREAAYAGDRPCAASLWSDSVPAKGALVVSVDRLGPNEKELESRLGPLVFDGQLSVERQGAVVRTARYYRPVTPP